MFTFALAALVFGATLILLINPPVVERARGRNDAYGRPARPEKRLPRPYILIPGLLIAGLLAALSFLTSVPARNIGVVTAFGRPTGQAFGPGLHVKPPWHKVNDVDGTVQSLDNVGAAPDPENPLTKPGRTTVRLKGSNAIMFVDNAYRWRIVPEQAPALFLDWRAKKGDDSDIVAERIGPGLVTQELTSAINEAVADYDPYSTEKPSNDVLAAEVVKRMDERVGDRVDTVSFTIPIINFDDATQARINDLQAEVARTKVATQAKATADAQAKANKSLAGSVSKDPFVIVAQCEQTHARLVERGGDLSGAPSCWPSDNNRLLAVPSR